MAEMRGETLELSPEVEAAFAEVDRLYLSMARSDPQLWGASTQELAASYSSTLLAVESGKLQGEKLLDALGWLDLLGPVLRARLAQRRYTGKGGLPT